jgi:hypothetical protein
MERFLVGLLRVLAWVVLGYYLLLGIADVFTLNARGSVIFASFAIQVVTGLVYASILLALALILERLRPHS